MYGIPAALPPHALPTAAAAAIAVALLRQQPLRARAEHSAERAALRRLAAAPTPPLSYFHRTAAPHWPYGSSTASNTVGDVVWCVGDCSVVRGRVTVQGRHGRHGRGEVAAVMCVLPLHRALRVTAPAWARVAQQPLAPLSALGLAALREDSDDKVANRDVGFRVGDSLTRPFRDNTPISLSRMVPRTHMYTYAANVWDLSIVQVHFLAPRAKPLRYDLFFSHGCSS